MPERPVLIVGAGPTGLVLAIELARRDVPFHLIDRRPEPLGRDRAVAMKARTLEVFEGLGLAQEFLERGRILRGINLFSGEAQVAAVTFEGLDSPFPLMLSIPEDETERILTDRLAQLGGRIERGVEFAGLEQRAQSVHALLRPLHDGGRRLEASWVVGTDGLHSAVRDAIGDEFEGHEYPKLWGVADAHLAGWRQPGDHAAVQIEPPVLIAFPLRDGRWRFTFRPPSAADDALALQRHPVPGILPLLEQPHEIEPVAPGGSRILCDLETAERQRVRILVPPAPVAGIERVGPGRQAIAGVDYQRPDAALELRHVLRRREPLIRTRRVPVCRPRLPAARGVPSA